MAAAVVPDVLAGHLGHLAPDQERAFASFKDVLSSARLYSPPAGTAPASHDDPTLLRFLRARRFDPNKALKQFQDAEAWRKQHRVTWLYATFDPDEFESTRRFYPRWTGRRDRNGLPVYVYRLASLAPIKSELDAVPPPRRYQRIVALYETMTRFVLRLCSHLPHATSPTPISSVTTIIDLENVSLGAIWSLRGHLQEASALATANYPETLSTIAVVNSPSFFPTVWSWVKPVFDEGTQRKVHVLGKDPGPVLRTLIDPQNLPRPYGGELDWKFEDEPSLDEDTKNVIGTMPKGPVEFVDGEVRKPPVPPDAPPK
ncbi:CRAL/TRIO domain-containing protein [Rhodofomes roseus]|uniref:CRAL/TRIO domain-containing protein n=1 Tax=Rhodofomes roseus TaxID=34475 RepID=A0ABQ8JZ87_9APHY|nr:CRAL/TRIO domain-containing protein [Rhodofomes roseus]KAH9829628.1 CRAL/TRIO domain-containing protein [Rhodofomes roseus]